jgi:disulfide bond formation protein DsbB
MKLLRPDRYALLSLLVAAAMLAAAHAFQRIGGYQPCPLCLRQREIYWIILPAAAVGLALLRGRSELTRVVPALLGALFLTSFVTAGFHAGVEWKWWTAPESCAVTGGAVSDLSGILRGERVRVLSCADVAWSLWGLSMAGWNALISLGMAALGFLTAATTPSEDGFMRPRLTSATHVG